MAESIKRQEIATSLVALETSTCHGEIARIKAVQTPTFFFCLVSIFTKKYTAKIVRLPKREDVTLIAKTELLKINIAGMER